MKICPLCKINQADNKNSHIIPKFLGKPLFEKIKPRHTLQLNKKGKARKIQDIPKEDNLICKSCEKRFEVLETYFSRKLVGLRNYNNKKDKFELSSIGPNTILKCMDLDPLLFKLFCYSLIWRISVTTNPLFKNFQLPKEIEIDLRNFLNKNLFEKHQELLNNLKSIEKYPDYHLLAFKPEAGNKDFIGILTAFQMSKDHYGIFTSDMILYFYIDDESIGQLLRSFSNNEDNNVQFVIANSSQWKELSSSVVRYRLLNNSS